MKKALLIAEKPSVAKDIKKAYLSIKNELDYSLDITAFRGHIMQLAEPDKYKKEWGTPWKYEVLPMFPEKFKLTHVKNTYSLYRDIKSLIKNNDYDFVINACDSAREGELIFWNFYNSLPFDMRKPVKRFWANDTTQDTLKRTLKNLIPENNIDILRLQQSAQLRAEMDWLLGINLTRALSIKTYDKIVVGRVMSATLKMIVDRENEIQNFIPQDTFELISKFKNTEGRFYIIENDNKKFRFINKKELNDYKKQIENQKFYVRSIKTKNKTKSPSKCMNLSDLQREANKKFGYSAIKTLNLAQSLYEKHKILSYPRTESRFISKSIAKDIDKYLEEVLELEEFKKFNKYLDIDKINNFVNNKKYVDDSKITDHHALLPTLEFKKQKLENLTVAEKNIFMLVLERFYSMFLPDFQEAIQIIDLVNLKNENLRFEIKQNKTINKGYEILNSKKEIEQSFLDMKEKEETVCCNSQIKKITSNPPALFTEGTLLSAMENVASVIENNELKKILKENSGIGTAATRAGIIEKLVAYKYIKSGKTIQSTDKGKEIISIIGKYSFSSPIITANWEKKLMEIEAGITDTKNVKEEFMDYLKENIEKIDEDDVIARNERILLEQEGAVVGNCPRCGENVIITRYKYACENYKNQDGGPTCDFALNKVICEAEITRDDMADMLEGEKSSIKTMTFKNGNKGKVQLEILKNGDLKFNFINTPVGKCPCCGKNVVEYPKSYICEGFDREGDGCKFCINKNILGARISLADCKKIIDGEKTSPKTMTFKSGDKARVRLGMKDNKLEFYFEK